jgi:hypothetical protein
VSNFSGKDQTETSSIEEDSSFYYNRNNILADTIDLESLERGYKNA